MRSAELEARVRNLLAAGDTDSAAEAVLRAMGPAVLRYMRAILREEEPSLDAFAAFGLDLWRGLPSFRGETSLRAWVHRVARHAVQSPSVEAKQLRSLLATCSAPPPGASGQGRLVGSTGVEGAFLAAELAAVDAQVQDLLAAGAAAAASEVVLREIGPAILRFVRAVLRDEALTAHAFSAFAEDLGRDLPSSSGRGSARIWAYRVAWRSMLRAQDRSWKGLPAAPGRVSQLAEEIRTRTPATREFQPHAIEAIRARLPLEDRSLLWLRLDEGLSWTDVAAVLAVAGQPVEPLEIARRFQRLNERIAGLARAGGLLD